MSPSQDRYNLNHYQYHHYHMQPQPFGGPGPGNGLNAVNGLHGAPPMMMMLNANQPHAHPAAVPPPPLVRNDAWKRAALPAGVRKPALLRLNAAVFPELRPNSRDITDRHRRWFKRAVKLEHECYLEATSTSDYHRNIEKTIVGLFDSGIAYFHNPANRGSSQESQRSQPQPQPTDTQEQESRPRPQAPPKPSSLLQPCPGKRSTPPPSSSSFPSPRSQNPESEDSTSSAAAAATADTASDLKPIIRQQLEGCLALWEKLGEMYGKTDGVDAILWAAEDVLTTPWFEIEALIQDTLNGTTPAAPAPVTPAASTSTSTTTTTTETAPVKRGPIRDPWDFLAAMEATFDGALKQAKKKNLDTKFRPRFKLLQDDFTAKFRHLMTQEWGYCCATRHTYTPYTLYCFGKRDSSCVIKRDAKFWLYKELYYFCKPCFSAVKGDSVTFEPPAYVSKREMTLPKKEFKETINNHVEYERMCACRACGRRFHQVCVSCVPASMDDPATAMDPRFTCVNCNAAAPERIQRAREKFSVKKLFSSQLATFMERHINKFFRGRLFDDNAVCPQIYIRVVNNSHRCVDVRANMRELHCGPRPSAATGQGGSRPSSSGSGESGMDSHGGSAGGSGAGAAGAAAADWPSHFPYRTKTILAFVELDGVEVCFFGMYVHEYASTCPGPNARRVHITYLDSVQLFRPLECRRAVYKQVILAYLAWARDHGYLYAHLWACPPQQGNDYIFFAHPPAQKFLNTENLQHWYIGVMDEGLAPGIVDDYLNMAAQATRDNLSSELQLPYFDGDFWPMHLETLIEDLKKSGKSAASMKTLVAKRPSGKGKKKAMKKTPGPGRGRPRKRDFNGDPKVATTSTSGDTDPQNPQDKDEDKEHEDPNDVLSGLLMEKITTTIQQHKNEFLIISLLPNERQRRTASAGLPLEPTTDPDPVFRCPIAETRDDLLAFARDKRYEFSSPRHAKFTTHLLLRALHESIGTVVRCAVSTCGAQLATCTDDAYTCRTCADVAATATRLHSHGDDEDSAIAAPVICDACRTSSPLANTLGHEWIPARSMLRTETPLPPPVAQAQDTKDGDQDQEGGSQQQQPATRFEITPDLIGHALACPIAPSTTDQATCPRAHCEDMKAALDHVSTCSCPQDTGCDTCQEYKSVMATHKVLTSFK